jgi:hypothetical protein
LTLAKIGPCRTAADRIPRRPRRSPVASMLEQLTGRHAVRGRPANGCAIGRTTAHNPSLPGAAPRLPRR